MSGFLRPDAAERARLAQRQQEREREAKRKREEAAKERKRKRDAEKARIAEIDAGVGVAASRPRVAAPAPAPVVDNSPAAVAQRNVDAYLDSKPYFGEHRKANKETVKEYCRGADGRSFAYDPERFQFGTRDPLAVINLLHSGLWTPRGVFPENHDLLVRTIRAREAEGARKAEAVSASVREEAVASAAQPPQPTEEQRALAEADRYMSTDVPPDTPEEQLRVHQLLLTPALAASATWGDLGPRGGISVAGRLLRFFDLLIDPERPMRDEVRRARTDRLVQLLQSRDATKQWPYASIFDVGEALDAVVVV